MVMATTTTDIMRTHSRCRGETQKLRKKDGATLVTSSKETFLQLHVSRGATSVLRTCFVTTISTVIPSVAAGLQTTEKPTHSPFKIPPLS